MQVGANKIDIFLAMHIFKVMHISHSQRRIENPIKHIRWSFPRKKATAFTRYFWKSSTLDVWLYYESAIDSTFESQDTVQTDGSINLFYPISYQGPLLISQKTSGNLWFSNDFREYRKKETGHGIETSNSKNHGFGNLVLKLHTTFAGLF